MIQANTAFSVYKSIASPKEQQLFFEMVQRDLMRSVKPSAALDKKAAIEKRKAELRETVQQQMLARQRKVLKLNKTTSASKL